MTSLSGEFRLLWYVIIIGKLRYLPFYSKSPLELDKKHPF